MGRILIVDDQAPSREQERILLESFGYEVMEASSGGEAVSAALEAPPDLVLLDLHMRLLDLFAVLAEFRKKPQLARLPIVALTASGTQEDGVPALHPGFSGYITKSVVPEDSRTQILTFLERHGMHP